MIDAHALVGVGSLLGQVEALPASVAEAPDEQGGQQGRLHLVSDGIRDGHVERVAVEVVVEGVAAD